MFSWTNRELNSEQSDAVIAPGNIFLAACPGSGKTRTLTYKIAYELSLLKSVREFVVAITYTNRAADEIRERVEELGLSVSNLWVGTIHAFCLEWIIRPYSIYDRTLRYGYRVIDQHERENLLQRLCAPHRSSRVGPFDCDYYVSETGYHLSCPDTSKHAAIQQVLAAYFKELQENRQIDFELILWYARKLLLENPIIGTLLSKLFSVILVDEYQDTKRIQYLILASILSAKGASSRLFMVGDPNQAIYGSLGGYAISLDELKDMTGLAIERRELSRNYRSSSRVTNFFTNFKVQETKIMACGKDRDHASLVSYNSTITREMLAQEVGRVIRYNVETLGVKPNEICVIAPWWIHLAAMTRQLVTQMPEYEFDGPGILPISRDAENFWFKVARIALTEPHPASYVKRMFWAREVIASLREEGLEVPGLSGKVLLRICNRINVKETDGLTFLKSYFALLCQQLNVRIEDFAQLREHYQAFFESSSARISRIENEGVTSVRDVHFFKKAFRSRSGITISTIHGVKGAEFDVVIAYALLEGMVPHFNDAEGTLSANKLLYVIGSRARKNLHLFSESDRPRGRYSCYAPTKQLLSCSFDYDNV